MGACGVQGKDIRDADRRVDCDQRYRHERGGRRYRGIVHCPRHWRLPLPQGLRPESQLNQHRSNIYFSNTCLLN